MTSLEHIKLCYRHATIARDYVLCRLIRGSLAARGMSQYEIDELAVRYSRLTR